MLFSKHIERQNQDIISAIIGGSFVSSLIAGTLKQEAFQYYIAQDISYLYNFAKAAALCAVKAPSKDLAFFTEMQQSALTEISAINGHYAAASGYNPPPGQSPANLHYSAYILQLAEGAPLEVAFAGLYPCPWLYMHIGQLFGQNVPSTHPYRHWLVSNGSPNYPPIIQTYSDKLNQYAEANPSLRPAMEEAARTALFHEYYFWQDAYQLKNFFSL